MGYYIARRLMQLVPILLGVSLVFFIIFNIVGGSEKFLYNVLPSKSRSAEQIEVYRDKYGLNDPMIVQYLRFTKDMFTFNFGRSETRKRLVTDLLKKHVPVSALLAFPAFFLQIVISLFFASLAVYYRGLWIDRMINFFAVLGMSLPMLVLIIWGQQFLAFKLDFFPVSGYETLARGGIRYFFLPWILWVVVSLGSSVKFFRTTLIEEASKDYVRTAQAKGQTQIKIMIFHVLRNGMIPILTYIVLSLPFLLTGSLLLERFFSIPGLGDLILNGVINYDVPVLKASITFFTYFFVVFSLLTDVLYGLVDPRINLK